MAEERLRCPGCGIKENDKTEFRAYTRVCPHCEKSEAAYDAASTNAKEAKVDLFGLKVDLKPIIDGKVLKVGQENSHS